MGIFENPLQRQTGSGGGGVTILPASTAEINAGVIGNKFIPPDNLALSDYKTLSIAIASIAEINAGVIDNKFIPPDHFAGSIFGLTKVPFCLVDWDTNVTIQQGKIPFIVPAEMNLLYLKSFDVQVGRNVIPVTGSTVVNIRKERLYPLGGGSTQWTIANSIGDTWRYSWTGVGSNPSIKDDDLSVRAGDGVYINAQNFNSANNGFFIITGVGGNGITTGWFDVTNIYGVAEANKTEGTGWIIQNIIRYMFSVGPTSNSIYPWIFGTGTINTNFYRLQVGDFLFMDCTSVHTGIAPKGIAGTVKFGL